MADNEQANLDEETASQDSSSQPDPQDTSEAEGTQPQDASGAEGGTVNKHKYDRDIANKDKEIAQLKAQLEASGQGRKTAEQRLADIEAKFSTMEKQLADEKVNSALTIAGCIDLKAARARLDEFNGDISKLKDAAPYLFAQKKQPSSTGFTPTGANGSAEERRKKARAAAGLKD